MSHKGSQETKDFIADWIAPDFFYSKKDVWHRMGMLGVFGDYVLSCTPGDVLEIGCGESSIYLSHVAKKYNRRSIHCDLAPDKILNPLTAIGYFAQHGVYLTQGEVENAHNKNLGGGWPSIFYAGTSDSLFDNLHIPMLALSFIDGDHNYAQVRKDFFNAFKRTVDNGYIILHDTYPPSDEYLSPDSACGDVYRLRQELEQYPDVDCLTLVKGTAMGVGLTICRKKPKIEKHYHE